MHFLVTVAVLVSAPPSGGAGARVGEARAALAAAERGRGAEVLEDSFALIRAGWTAERNLAFFGRGAQLVSDGRRALERVELEKAQSLFAEAGLLYRPHVQTLGVPQEWAEAAKWRGVALFELKRRVEATNAFSLAKLLEPDSPLTDAMVRPDVARAYAAAPVADLSWAQLPGDSRMVFPPDPISSVQELGVDVVIEAAIAIDAGVLTYAASRHEASCVSDVITATRVDELVRRVHEAPCKAGAAPSVERAPAIAHPRPAPTVAKAERPTPVWRKPWLWVTVVGTVGVGVVLAASLWPRDASYTATADFHSFALGGR